MSLLLYKASDGVPEWERLCGSDTTFLRVPASRGYLIARRGYGMVFCPDWTWTPGADDEPRKAIGFVLDGR